MPTPFIGIQSDGSSPFCACLSSTPAARFASGGNCARSSRLAPTKRSSLMLAIIYVCRYQVKRNQAARTLDTTPPRRSLNGTETELAAVAASADAPRRAAHRADGDAQCVGEGAAEGAAGVAAVVAAKTAAQVPRALCSRAARFAPQLLSPAEGLRRALPAPPGLVAVTNPADNALLPPAAADTPALFKALLALRPKVATVFACFADAEVVAAAHVARAGSRLAITLGASDGRCAEVAGHGRPSRLVGRAVAQEAIVKRLARRGHFRCSVPITRLACHRRPRYSSGR